VFCLYRFLIRDSICSSEFASSLNAMGLSNWKTAFRAPPANAFCEHPVGTLRRERVDFLIPLTERHLRGIPQEWVAHYNEDRAQSSQGPGLPLAEGKRHS
jgi:putative transposase